MKDAHYVDDRVEGESHRHISNGDFCFRSADCSITFGAMVHLVCHETCEIARLPQRDDTLLCSSQPA